MMSYPNEIECYECKGTKLVAESDCPKCFGDGSLCSKCDGPLSQCSGMYCSPETVASTTRERLARGT